MSCDICDINELFQRPGVYSTCRNCGAEYGWIEVDASELRALVDEYALLTIDADEPEDGFLLRQRRLKEKAAELQDFLWKNRYGIRNAAIEAERVRESQDRLAALSRIVRRALASHQLEKLEDARRTSTTEQVNDNFKQLDADIERHMAAFFAVYDKSPEQERRALVRFKLHSLYEILLFRKALADQPAPAEIPEPPFTTGWNPLGPTHCARCDWLHRAWHPSLAPATEPGAHANWCPVGGDLMTAFEAGSGSRNSA